MVYSTDLLKWFWLSQQKAQWIDFNNKAQSSVWDFMKWVSPEQSKMEAQEFQKTWLFSQWFRNQFTDYLKNLQIQKNDTQIFWNQDIWNNNSNIWTSPIWTNTPNIEVPKIDTPTINPPTETPKDTPSTISTWTQAFDTWSPILDKELENIKSDKNEAIEDKKKQFLLWKADFEKNKQYYTNFDQVNNLYNGVVDDLIAVMDNYWVVSDSDYQRLASKYNLTIDELKNPNSLLERANLSDEGKDKLWITKAESQINDLTTTYERKKKDIEDSIAKTQQNFDWQIEDTAKQLARTIGWTEAQGAWNNALKSSWYMVWIENIRRDGENTISRLRTLADQAISASQEDIWRLTEDYNKVLWEARKDFDDQVSKIKMNSILALSSAQANYSISSDKLTRALDQISEEYWMKSTQAVNAYLMNLKAMNDLANQNMNLIEKASQLEEQKTNTRYNEYLANNGALLQNSSIKDLVSQVQNWEISLKRFQDLQNIMTNSIQATLWNFAPLTGEDLQTINMLMGQGFTPSQVVATMQESFDKFTPKQSLKDNYISVWGNLFDTVNKTWVPQEEQYKTFDFWWNLYRQDSNWNIELAIQWPTKYTKLDDGTYQDNNGNIITKSELEQQKLLSNSYLNASAWTNVWIECGQYARSATWLTSTPGGNSLSERIKKFSETSPMPGWMVLFNWWNYDKTYGHIAVVTGINADWSITVKESNLNWDKKVTERTISLNDPNISWFYNNTPLAGGNGTDSSFNATDIRVFNSLTPSEKAKKQNDPKFMNFVEQQNKIFSNPDIDLDELLKYSAWWGKLWETSKQQLSKFNQALSQVSELTDKINNQTTWPILWKLRSYNPYDSNAQALKAEINSLIPNIARWVYGEVWVLTDADIEQYRKTLPNLQSTEDTNKLVLAMTLKTMMNWYKWQLQTLASAWDDVSLFQWKYKDYENIVNGLLNWIWAWNNSNMSSSQSGRWQNSTVNESWISDQWRWQSSQK